MRSLHVVLLVALALVLVPHSARAETNKLQVLTIVSPDAFENARSLTIALKRAVTRTEGWSLSPGDFSLEVLMAGFDCEEPPNQECLNKVADSVESDRFIWGTMSVAGNEVVAHLRFWEDGRNVSEKKLTYSANLTDPSDDNLLKLAEDAFNELLGVSEGTLVVLAGSVNGEVFVNGKSQGRIIDGRAELLVSSGQLEVEVRAPGFRPAKGKVTVRPGANAEVVLTVVPASEGTQSVGKERRPISAQKLAGYGALGVGSIVAIVGGVYWVSSYQQTQDGDYEEYLSQVPEGTNPCEVARGNIEVPNVEPSSSIADHCDQNETTRTMARILTPAGVIVAAAGVVLIVTDKPKRERAARRRRVRPHVAIGPRGGRLDLSVQF